MKLATQRTLQLGEVVDDAVDLELDLPLGVFLCNQCADSVDEKAMVANVKEWCERREHKGDCHAVDPGMCTTLVEIMKLRASSKDLARTKSEMIQEGEGLKERCAVAAKAMKNRQYTMCLQRCPERNPYDTDQYNDAASNIDQWEHGKLQAHQNRVRELEEAELSMETKYNQLLYKTGMSSYNLTSNNNMNMNVQPPIEVADTVDQDLMSELESMLLSPRDKAGSQIMRYYVNSCLIWALPQ